jgi:hypothetical protein
MNLRFPSRQVKRKHNPFTAHSSSKPPPKPASNQPQFAIVMAIFDLLFERSGLGWLCQNLNVRQFRCLLKVRL